MLYLESGLVPVRFILMARRLNFLWYILNENADTLINKFFKAQLNNPVRGDWVSRVKLDLNDLKIDLNLDDIQSKSKNEFKEIVKTKVKIKAFEYLTAIQQSHSKSKNIVYNKFDLQDYLKPLCKLTIKEKQFTFAARTHMLDLHCNFKIGKSDLLCRKCSTENETQKHIMICPAINENDLTVNNQIPTYENIYQEDTSKLELTTKILMKKFKQDRTFFKVKLYSEE